MRQRERSSDFCVVTIDDNKWSELLRNGNTAEFVRLHSAVIITKIAHEHDIHARILRLFTQVMERIVSNVCVCLHRFDAQRASDGVNNGRHSIFHVARIHKGQGFSLLFFGDGAQLAVQLEYTSFECRKLRAFDWGVGNGAIVRQWSHLCRRFCEKKGHKGSAVGVGKRF